MTTRRRALHYCAVLMFLLISSSVGAGAEGEWIVLFDGKSTDAWRGYKQDAFPDKGWTVENGAIKTVAGAEAGDIITRDKFKDFELEYEWRVSPGANSGVFYNVAETGARVYETGPEMQVLDDEKHKDGKNPTTSAGALYALIAPSEKATRPVGEFNKARIVVKSGHVEHWLNGKKVVEYDLTGDAIKAMIAGSKFKEMPMFARETEGHIALQHHGDEVWFRNIRIRRL
jgi:hypothetical protein